jgi:hypothetical protein
VWLNGDLCFASSSWTSTQRCAGALSCSNKQSVLCQSSGLPCSGACLQSLLLGRITCEQFHFLGDDGDIQVADCHFSCQSYRKHHVSSPVLIQLRNVPFLSALSIRSQVLMQSSRWSCFRTHGTMCWVTQDMFRSSDRILWQIPRPIGAHGSVVVKALCYKLEGSGFETQRGDFFNLPNPSNHNRPWGSLSL